MKRNAVFLMTLLVVLMVSFTSCLNSDSGSSWDYYNYFTKSSGYLGGASYNYITDNGYYFYISGLTETPERAVLYVKLAEGEEVKTDAVIKATVYTGYGVNINDFTNRKDTIEANVNDFAIAELTKNTSTTTNTWSANGYLNIGFKYYADSYSTYYNNDVTFELLAESVEAGVLNARLVQTRGGVLPGNTPYATSDASIICYRLPTVDELNTILGEEVINSNVIQIRIIANSIAVGSQLELDPIEVTLNY